MTNPFKCSSIYTWHDSLEIHFTAKIEERMRWVTGQKDVLVGNLANTQSVPEKLSNVLMEEIA